MSAALVWAGVALAAAATLGALRGAGAADRIHFLGVAGPAAALLVLAGVLTDAAPAAVAAKAVLVVVLVVGEAPLSGHVLVRLACLHARKGTDAA